MACAVMAGSVLSNAQQGADDPTFHTGTGFDAVNMWDRVTSCVAIQPDGRILVGGGFNTYDGVTRNRLARLNQDGSLDTTFVVGTGFNNGQPYKATASILVQPDSRILVGGSFTTYNGTGCGNIIRLMPDGLRDPSFVIGSGFSDPAGIGVLPLVLQPDGRIIAGGGFTSYNGSSAGCIARLNSDGSRDTTFHTGTGFDQVVYALAVQPDGRILVSGQFTAYNGVPCASVVRLNTDGVMDTTFNVGSGPNDFVGPLALLPDGCVLVGGAFTLFNNVATNRIVRLLSDGAVDTTFHPGAGFNDPPYGRVNCLTVQADGAILAGGRFFAYAGAARSRIARLLADGGLDTSFDPGTGFDNAFPWTGLAGLALQADGKIIPVGAFTLYDGVPRNYITRIQGACVPGASCNDGIPTTGPDSYTAECVCTGPLIDCLGVPAGPAMPGTPCDDGSVSTGDDLYQPDCSCRGSLIDCLGVIGGPALPGTTCDDGNGATGGDVYTDQCVCAGLLLDCLGVPGGNALPGSACDDGQVLTGPDLWMPDCECVGKDIDCLGIPNGPALPGTPCDDGLISTVDDVYSTSCVCTGVTICISSQLTTVEDPVISCGATGLKLDGSDLLAASEVPGANRYQFFFNNVPGQPYYSRHIAFNERTFILVRWWTNPLKAGRTYNVTVRASYDGGATWCPYGPSCTVRISHHPLASAPQSRSLVADDQVSDLLLYPDPNSGQGFFMAFAEAETSGVPEVEMSDMTGRRIPVRAIPSTGNSVFAVEPLERVSDGVYVVTATWNGRRHSHRLMVTR